MNVSVLFFRAQTMKKDIKANINIGDAIQYAIKSYKESECPVVKSGIDTLDTFTNGWYPGEFCIVGGRPGMGKTAFILSMMSNIAISKVPAVLFSTTDSLNIHFMSRIVSCIKSESDCLGIEEKLQMIENSDLHDVPLYFNMQSNLKLEYIKEQSEYLIKEKGVKIIFIETIQSIFNSEENGNTKEVMEMICHKLKCMSTELNVPIIVTSDLNRSPEHREGIEGKIPQIADIRSCSAIENCADSIYLLYRPECYGIRRDGVKDLRGVMNIFIAKKKYNSKQGMIEVGFNHNNGRIYDFNNDTLSYMQYTNGPF